MKATLKKTAKNILQKLGLMAHMRSFRALYYQNIFQLFLWYFYNNILTFFPIHWVRIFYLKKVLGLTIGKSSFIHLSANFNGNISIGNNSVIGRRCSFIGDIRIGNNVSITAETYIFTSSHILDNPNFDCFYTEVVIDDYAWIGARAMILPGVKIGRGAVLGAASTATKDIPDCHIFAGCPAKKVGIRPDIFTYNIQYSPFFQ